jgi:hypothetical protein
MRFGGKHSLSRNLARYISGMVNVGAGVTGGFARVRMPAGGQTDRVGVIAVHLRYTNGRLPACSIG